MNTKGTAAMSDWQMHVHVHAWLQVLVTRAATKGTMIAGNATSHKGNKRLRQISITNMFRFFKQRPWNCVPEEALVSEPIGLNTSVTVQKTIPQRLTWVTSFDFALAAATLACSASSSISSAVCTRSDDSLISYSTQSSQWKNTHTAKTTEYAPAPWRQKHAA